MRFKKVTIQNFLSYGPAQEVDLFKRGVVGIFGINADGTFSSNGSGKSSLMESIIWCLWGETLRGLKSDEVVNQEIGKNCEVVLVLEAEGQEYTIRRIRKMTGVKKSNDLFVFTKTKDLTQGTVTSTQALINDIVGCDFTTFTQSVLLTNLTQSFCTLTDSKQKEILENILQVDLFKKAQGEVRARRNALQNDLAAALQKVQSVESRIGDLESEVKVLSLKSDKFQATQEVTLNGLRKRLEDIGVTESLESLTETLKELNDRIEIIGGKKVALQNNLAELNLKQGQVVSSTSELLQKIRSAGEKVSYEINHTQERITHLSKEAGKECYTCYQVIDPDVAEAQINDLQNSLNELENKAQKLEDMRGKVVEAERTDLDPIEREKAVIEEKIKDIVAEDNSLRNKVNEVVASLARAEAAEKVAAEIRSRIVEEEARENPYIELISRAQEAIKKEKTELKSARLESKKFDVEIKALNFWDRGFGNAGIKAYLLDNVIPFLNERAQKYADVLSGGNIKIRFSPQSKLKSGELREKFEVVVTNKSGADVYKANSSGERRRSDIAISWALADLASARAHKPIKFRGLDEPFENLDSEGIDAVFRLLMTAAKEHETIFVISHNSDLKNRFSNELTIVKGNGFSKVIDLPKHSR